MNGVLGGWQLYWIGYMETGHFFSPSYSGSDPSNTNTVGGLPDRLCNGNLPSDQRSIDHWFDARAFAAAGRPLGNSGPFVLEGPGTTTRTSRSPRPSAITERLISPSRLGIGRVQPSELLSARREHLGSGQRGGDQQHGGRRCKPANGITRAAAILNAGALAERLRERRGWRSAPPVGWLLTRHPCDEWMILMARNATDEGSDSYVASAAFFMIDSSFGAVFLDVLRIKRNTAVGASTQESDPNAFSERWVCSPRQECLSKVSVFEGPVRFPQRCSSTRLGASPLAFSSAPTRNAGP